ncbi:MAG: T9SS type A sorting domain-containing protein [Candidatus Delongbacteria bacterium]|nr:T9SS type A sorting domain-containing protein [Candidatus Delongbacteria bacterium]MBN2836349.1 T9SS type A sorting domain-containing protein [Candidatus Delongbacteria bacterium]
MKNEFEHLTFSLLILLIFSTLSGEVIKSDPNNLVPLTSIDGIEITSSNFGNKLKTISDSFDSGEIVIEGDDSGDYLINFENLNSYFIPQEPQVPYKNYRIEIEGNFDISDITFAQQSKCYKSNFDFLIRSNGKITENEGNINIDRSAKNETYYSNSFYPGKWITFDYGFDGKYTIVYIKLFPFHWNPVQKKIINMYGDFELAIFGTKKKTFVGTRRNNIEVSTDNHIIITPGEFKTVVDSIALYHTNQGVSTSVIELETITESYEPAENPELIGISSISNPEIINYDYTIAKKIVSYLRDVDVHPKLELVTIVGNGVKVPTSYYVSLSNTNYTYVSWIPTDQFYSSPDYDWIDNYGLARIPVETINDLSNYYHKLLRWNSSPKDKWKTKVSLSGGCPFDKIYLYGELSCNLLLTNDLLNGFDVDKYYNTNGKFKSNEVLNHISNDDFFIDFTYAHDSGNNLHFDDGSKITVDDLQNLSAKDNNGIFLGMSCINGAYDSKVFQTPFIEDKSYGEGLICSKGGGIAYIGGSRSLTGIPSFDLKNGQLYNTRHSLNLSLFYFFFEAYREAMTDNDRMLGSLVKKLKDKYIDYYGVHNFILDKLERMSFLSSAALLLPEPPTNYASGESPDVRLKNGTNEVQGYQTIHLNATDTPKYTISDDLNYNVLPIMLTADDVNLLNFETYEDFYANRNFTIDNIGDNQKVLLRVEGEDKKEIWHYSLIIRDEVGIDDNIENSFTLYQNYPNPFNPETSIMFILPMESIVKLSIYNISGSKIYEKSIKALSGLNNFIFNGENLSSGQYFYKIETDNFSDIKKMILLK